MIPTQTSWIVRISPGLTPHKLLPSFSRPFSPNIDPLSITLAVITIATAIKDLVELSQKVKDSVSQVARNNKEALILSEEMVETINELKIFCNDYQEILETSVHMKTSLIKLTREMQATYGRISAILPSPTGKTFRQMKVKMQAWIRRTMVQDEIRELKDRVSQCYLRFTTFTVMRIEGQLKQTNHTQMLRTRRTSVHDQVQRSSAALNEGLVQLRVSDQRVASFIGSTSIAHPHSALELSENLISDMYLHCQVGRIDKLLSDLPAIQFSSMDNPSGRYARVFEVNGVLGVWDRNATRDAVVRQTLEIQDILYKGHTFLTVEEATWELEWLSSRLRSLDMDNDSAMTIRWTAHLLRTLVNSNSKVYMPYLVQALLDLSASYLKTQEIENASVAIFESKRLMQTLLATGSGERELTILHCRILTALGQLASEQGDHAEALLLFEEAVKRFETLLHPYFITTNATCKPLDTSWNLERRYLALRDYSYSLHWLSSTLQALKRLEDAVFLAKKAVAVIRFVMIKYPESIIQQRLAQILHQLSSPVLHQVVNVQDAYEYSKGSAALYRKFYNRDPQIYEFHLYDALWQSGDILEKMNQRSDALLVRQEMADLARRITHNKTPLAKALRVLSEDLHLVRRHDEAVIMWIESIRTYRTIYKTISIEEAHGHHNISWALQRSGRFQEALVEAEEAVTQYRALAFQKPDQHRVDLAHGLRQLSDILNNAGNYPRAFNEAHESLKQYESIISTRPEVVEHYVMCLATNMRVARNLRHETKSVERGEDVIRQFRQLMVRYPTEAGVELAYAMRTYSSLLYNLDMIPESIDWCRQSLELCESHTPMDADNFARYMGRLILLSFYLWTQGYFSRALEPLWKAIAIGEKHVSQYPSLTSILIDAKYRSANIMCDLGRYPEALEYIKCAITLHRETGSSNTKVLVRCLMRSSRTHLLNGNPQDAITGAREAIQLCREQRLLDQLSFSLHLLAEGLLDNGIRDEAQEAIDEVGSTDISWRHSIHELWVHSIFLFSKGMLPDEADLLWVRRWYMKRTEKRPAFAPQFAKILWMLGIFYCAQGRHEEGQAAATELKEFMLKIQAYPESSGVAEKILEYEQNRPSWKAVIDLSCHHQDSC